MPPMLAPLGVFECFSTFNIDQHYLEAILSKFHASIRITSKIQV